MRKTGYGLAGNSRLITTALEACGRISAAAIHRYRLGVLLARNLDFVAQTHSTDREDRAKDRRPVWTTGYGYTLLALLPVACLGFRV
jgi:hypothetical protein